MSNNISFGSNINFVPCNIFLKNHLKGVYIDYHNDFINTANSPEFHTQDIADCIAGGIIHPKKKNVGFHITSAYRLKAPPFDILGQPDRALLIGSKDSMFSRNSLANFKTMKEYLEKTVKHLSFFQEHKPILSSSSIHYSDKDDTWTICTGYRLLSEIKSLNELLEVFRKVKISDGDRLFINGKEVLPADCPEIFQ